MTDLHAAATAALTLLRAEFQGHGPNEPETHCIRDLESALAASTATVAKIPVMVDASEITAALALAAAPPGLFSPLPGEPVNTVLGEIAAERRRQIEAEGWTPEHDDQHSDGTLALAGACYARYAATRNPVGPYGYPGGPKPTDWPWADSWWKPKDQRRDLVRVGALIVAELERLDRVETAAARWEWIDEVVAYVKGLSADWTDDKARSYAESLFHNTCTGDVDAWPDAIEAVEEDRQDWTE